MLSKPEQKNLILLIHTSEQLPEQIQSSMAAWLPGCTVKRIAPDQPLPNLVLAPPKLALCTWEPDNQQTTSRLLEIATQFPETPIYVLLQSGDDAHFIQQTFLPVVDDFLILEDEFSPRMALRIALKMLKSDRQREDFLHQFTQIINSDLDLSSMLSSLLPITAQMVNAQSAFLLVFPGNGKGIDISCTYQLPENIHSHLSEHWQRWVNRETICVNHFSGHTQADPWWEKVGVQAAISIPLKDNASSTVGNLVLLRLNDNLPFTNSDIRLMENIGSQIGTIIHTTRTLAQTRRRLNERTILHELAKAGAEATSPDIFLDQITQIIGELFSPSNYGVLLWDTNTSSLKIHPSYRHPDHSILKNYRRAQSITGQVAINGKSVLISESNYRNASLCLDPQTKSVLCAPIKSNGKILGVINLESLQSDAFLPENQRVLETIVNQLGTALERLRLFEAEQQRRRESEILAETTASLTTSLNLEHIISNILNHLQKVVAFDSATFFLVQGDCLHLVAAKGLPQTDSMLGSNFPVHNPLYQQISRTRKPIVLADAQQDDHFAKWGNTDYVRGWMGIPLIVQDEMLGFLAVDSRRVNAYGSEQAALGQAFANQAALAIQNARLLTDSQRRTQELDGLYSLLMEISGDLDPDSILRKVQQALYNLIAPDLFVIGRITPRNQQMTIAVAAAQGRELSHLTGETLPLNHMDAINWVIRSQQPLLINDASQPPIIKPPTNMKQHFRSWAGMPLIFRGRLIAIMVLQSYRPDAFDQHHLRFLTSLAHQIAVILDNADLYQETLHAAKDWAVFHLASQEIATASFNLKKVCQAIHRAAEQLMPCDAFAITLYHQQSQEIEAVYLIDQGESFPGFRFQAEKSLTGRVMATGKPLHIDDLLNDPLCDTQTNFGKKGQVRSILAVPMHLGGKVFGILSTQSYQTYAYSAQDTTRLEMLAAHAAVAIENARLFEATRRNAIHMQIAAEVARDATALDEVDDLLNRVVNLIRDRFGFYHTGIFLVDEHAEYAVLKAAAGEIGHQMLQKNHQIKIGKIGIVGHVASLGEPRIANKVQEDEKHYQNPLLPETRAEMSIPIQLGKNIIGVLDIQSREENAFQQDDIAVLQVLSDQIAVAIENANLFGKELQQQQELESLRKASLKLTSSLDLQTVLNTILEQIVNLSHPHNAQIFLYDGENCTFGASFWDGIHHDRPIANLRKNGVTYKVAQTGHPIVIPDARHNPWYRDNPWDGALISMPLYTGKTVHGVMNVTYTQPHAFGAGELRVLGLLANQASIALENARLYQELEDDYIQTVLSLAKAMDARDSYTSNHSQEMAAWAVETAQQLKCTPQEIETARWGAILHDIGKIGIPDSILHKPDKLTKEEMGIIYTHPDIGAEIIAPVKRLAHLAPIIQAHQEKYDGSGYPKGLKGEEIPLPARILAVVDSYSAMIDKRGYKEAITQQKAIQEIKRQSGSQFDPRVVKAFLQILKAQSSSQSGHSPD